LYLSRYRSGTGPSEDLVSLLLDARQFGVEADKIYERQHQPKLSISEIRREFLDVALIQPEDRL
jgi:hypothetical protein